MLGREDAVERPRRRQALEASGALGPDQAVAEARVMGRLGQVGQGSHARAVGTQGHDSPAGQVLHTVGIGVRPGGRLARDRVGGIAPSFGEGPVVFVAEPAPEQDDVARPERAMGLLPGHDPLLRDQGALAGGRGIEQIGAIDDARLPAELPGGDHVRVRSAEGTGVGQAGVGGRDGVRGDVELGAGVAVDRQDIDVIRAERADALMVDQEPRPGRPGARVFRGHEQGEVEESLWGLLLRDGHRG